jgi:hypothetical protein
LGFTAKALDEYAAFRSRLAKPSDDDAKIDTRLEAIVERMLNKCDLKFQLTKKKYDFFLVRKTHYQFLLKHS